MKLKTLAVTSWIPFLMSAVSEWGLEVDLPLTPVVWLMMAAVLFFATNARAALTTNSWQVSSGKWEIGINWDQGVPAPSDSINFLNKTIPVGITRTITIDAATVLSNNISGNNCLTISNLTLSGTSMSLQVLLLTNATLATPLTIVSNLTINVHTFVVISNAALRVGVTSAGTVSDDSGLTMYAGSLIATNLNSSFVIGNTGNGDMTVLGGTWQSGFVHVGNLAGSQGTLTVAGGTNTMSGLIIGQLAGAAGAVWLTGGQLTVTNNETLVGEFGVGQMSVSNGTWLSGTVRVGFFPGSQGTLTIAGGTNLLLELFHVGDQAGSTGAVWMTGGQLTVTGSSSIGGFGVGHMTVSNGTWNAGALIVGFGSPGTLTIAGGINTLSGSIGLGLSSAGGAAGTGVVWLTGGQLTVTNDTTNVGYLSKCVGQMTVSNGAWRALSVAVGVNGGSQGTLTVAGGTNTLSSLLQIGSAASATGAVWLTGGQLVTTNGVAIAVAGVGQLTLSNGTWITGDVGVGLNAGSQGTLTIATGQFAVTNASTVIGSNGVGQLIQAGGTMFLRDVRVALNPSSHGTLTAAGGTGSVYSNLTIGDFPCTATGAVVVAGGNLFVTNSTTSAVLEVRTGTLTLNSGVLVLDTLVMTNACAHFVHTGGTLIINNYPPVLDPASDMDGDGIPNGYELSHGLDPFNAADAALDNDGDGLTNLQEFQTGTDPNDSASGLRILNLLRQDPDMRITWTGGGGTNYVVQAANGGPGGSFTNDFSTLATISLSGVGDKTNTYIDAFGATNSPAHYYRVRLAP